LGQDAVQVPHWMQALTMDRTRSSARRPSSVVGDGVVGCGCMDNYLYKLSMLIFKFVSFCQQAKDKYQNHNSQKTNHKQIRMIKIPNRMILKSGV
jgi:hypothetical protein